MVIYSHVFGKAIQLKKYIYVTLRAQRGLGMGWYLAEVGEVDENAKTPVEAPEMTVELGIINK